MYIETASTFPDGYFDPNHPQYRNYMVTCSDCREKLERGEEIKPAPMPKWLLSKNFDDEGDVC
jgi:hypothetical protein